MMNRILIILEVTLFIGLFTMTNYGQSAAVLISSKNAGTVNAVIENTSNRSVLIWAAGYAPKTLADTGKFRVVPGSKKGLAVIVPPNGQVKFNASAGPSADKTDITGPIVGTCTWRQEPNAPTKVPYVVYNGSGLTCGNITK